MNWHGITILGFLLILGAMLTTEALARSGHTKLPTFAQVCTRIMRSKTGRVGMLVAWAWVGLHFFAK
jgi:uncharacterized protein DUF6186